MNSTSSYSLTSSFALLLVGEPKTGKTSLASAFPNPWFLDLDGNLASAIRRNGPTKTMFFDTIPKDYDASKKIELAESLIIAATNDKNVQTLVLDSTTTLHTLVSETILANLRRLGVKLRSDTVDDQLRIADYATYGTYILRLVARFRASGKYVIWCAHQTPDKDELTGAIRYQVTLAGKAGANLGAFFTDVWASVAYPKPGGGIKYAVRTKPSNMHVSLGSSFPIDAEVDITDKTPDQIWSILSPKITTLK